VDDVIKEFLSESFDGLRQMEQCLGQLENDPSNRDRLAHIYRAIQTIKGTCGFFEFSKLGELTIPGENLLSRLNSGQMVLDDEIKNALLALVVKVREFLTRIDASGSDAGVDAKDLIETLSGLCNRGGRAV
jgi:two-component system chemotaxis sensor kinase CheA